jgi:hypothetical protein
LPEKILGADLAASKFSLNNANLYHLKTKAARWVLPVIVVISDSIINDKTRFC